MENKMKKLMRATALIAGMTTTGVVIAATQGTVGGISTGDLDIDVTINDEVQISNLTDLTGTFTGVDMTLTDTACVYRNAGGDYTVTAQGDGAANAFTITDGATVVPYTVQWSSDGGTTFESLATSVTSASHTGNAAPDCSAAPAGDNVTIQVDLAAIDLVAAAAGTLSGTLTLTVAPN